MRRLRRFAHRLLILSPLIAVGLSFQNFTELEVPVIPEKSNHEYGTTATSVEGAAEQFVRTQWMPELRNLENRWAEKLQFRFEQGAQPTGEVEMNLVGGSTDSKYSEDPMKISVVNDRVRVQFTGINLAADYTPAKDLLSVRTNLNTPGQIHLEHSGRDRTSRVSWQMSW